LYLEQITHGQLIKRLSLNIVEICEHVNTGFVRVKDIINTSQQLYALCFAHTMQTVKYKNSSGDEIANVNFYTVRPEATRIR